MWIKTERGWKLLLPRTAIFVDTIKEQGKTARKTALNSDACPYLKGTSERDRWLTGWCEQDLLAGKGLG